MKTTSFEPILSATGDATDFVEATLNSEGCPDAVVMKMCIAIDELFSNIARYSGATQAKIACGVQDGAAVLTLWDDGAPYDPTAGDEPDTTLTAQDRNIGGLGIHMVRRIMSDVLYTRRDGWNELTVRREFAGGLAPCTPDKG